MRILAAAALLTGLLATPAAAEKLYCLADADLSWHRSGLRVLERKSDHHGFGGWHEFWVDTASGAWLGRTIGSRALTSEGGTFDIVNDGTGYRADWIGVGERGFTILRIDLQGGDEAGYPFLRSDRDQAIHMGRCRDSAGRDFLDGVERPK